MAQNIHQGSHRVRHGPLPKDAEGCTLCDAARGMKKFYAEYSHGVLRLNVYVVGHGLPEISVKGVGDEVAREMACLISDPPESLRIVRECADGGCDAASALLSKTRSTTLQTVQLLSVPFKSMELAGLLERCTNVRSVHVSNLSFRAVEGSGWLKIFDTMAARGGAIHIEEYGHSFWQFGFGGTDWEVTFDKVQSGIYMVAGIVPWSVYGKGKDPRYTGTKAGIFGDCENARAFLRTAFGVSEE